LLLYVTAFFGSALIKRKTVCRISDILKFDTEDSVDSEGDPTVIQVMLKINGERKELSNPINLIRANNFLSKIRETM